LDPERAKALWTMSEEMVGEHFADPTLEVAEAIAL
jgi:hypothetical protein